MLTVVIVIHLMLVMAMIGVVLLQKSEGGGLISSTGGLMTGRGTANVLTRTTALLAIGFFITSLALSWLAGVGRHSAATSIVNPQAPISQGVPKPALGQGEGVLNQLGGGKAPASSAPASPQVPQSK